MCWAGRFYHRVNINIRCWILDDLGSIPQLFNQLQLQHLPNHHPSMLFSAMELNPCFSAIRKRQATKWTMWTEEHTCSLVLRVKDYPWPIYVVKMKAKLAHKLVYVFFVSERYADSFEVNYFILDCFHIYINENILELKCGHDRI